MSKEQLISPPTPVEIIGVEHIAENAGRVVERLADVDCVLFESLGGAVAERNKIMDDLNLISEGRMSDEALDEQLKLTNDFTFHVVAGLRGTNKLILLIDTPEDPTDPAWQAVSRQRRLEKELQANAMLSSHPTEQEIEALPALKLALDTSDRLREAKMAQQILELQPKLEAHFGKDAAFAAIVGSSHAESIQQQIKLT